MYRYVCIILLFLFTVSLSAQEETYDYREEVLAEAPAERKSFDKKTWEKATRGLDYTVRERKPKDQKKPEPKPENEKNENSKTLFIILGVILIAVIIALIVAALTGHLKPANRKVHGMNVSIDDIEENIFESDLQGFIRQALNQSDYRLAIRLYFLEILKELALQKKIKWKKEKTNRIYFYELQASEMAADFGQLAVIFDRVRYGQTSIQKADFETIEPQFKDFLRKLNPKKLSTKHG